MQRRAMLRGVTFAAFVCSAVIIAAGCGRKEDTAPAIGEVQVALSRSKVALGSPVEVSYKFVMAPNAPSLGTRRVFVHFLDADDEMMWTDDHDPPTPTSDWKPGQTIELGR